MPDPDPVVSKNTIARSKHPVGYQYSVEADILAQVAAPKGASKWRHAGTPPLLKRGKLGFPKSRVVGSLELLSAPNVTKNSLPHDADNVKRH